MEAVKVNNDVAKASLVEAGFFVAGLVGRFLRSGYIWVRGTPTRLMKKYPVCLISQTI